MYKFYENIVSHWSDLANVIVCLAIGGQIVSYLHILLKSPVCSCLSDYLALIFNYKPSQWKKVSAQSFTKLNTKLHVSAMSDGVTEK